jgi:hypothetical protein
MMGSGGCLFKDAGGEWTYEASNVLVEALKSGVEVVIVSGRNRSQLREAARVMGIRDYISELGAEISYNQGKENVPLIGSFKTDGKSVYEAIKDRGVIEALFSRFGDTLEYHTPWSNEPRSYSHLLRGAVDVEKTNDWLAENGHMDLKLVDNGQLASRGERINDHIGVLHAYHLLPEAVDKAGAVRFDMERRGFAPGETVALGDSWADLSLAAVVGTFYLMKNGLEADPTLAEAIKDIDNVVVSKRDKSLGWADSVNDALGQTP